MVPFSFKSERSYLRVMQRYLTDKYWMMGSMDFWINGSRCRSSTVMLDPTSMMLDSIGGKRESREDREDCEVWNSQLLSPKFWLLASARFKPVLKRFKPIYTIQGTLFLSHAERQGLSSEAPGPAEAPAKGDWRRGLGVSASRRQEVFDAGARRTTAGAAVLPKNEDGGHGSRGLSPHQIKPQNPNEFAKIQVNPTKSD